MDSSYNFDINIIVINGYRFIGFGFRLGMWVLAAWKRTDTESSCWQAWLQGGHLMQQDRLEMHPADADWDGKLQLGELLDAWLIWESLDRRRR